MQRGRGVRHSNGRCAAASAPFIGILFFVHQYDSGHGEGLPSLILTVCRQGLIFIPLIFLLNSMFGLDGVIYAQPTAPDYLSILVGILICVHLFRSMEHRERKYQLGVFIQELSYNRLNIYKRYRWTAVFCWLDFRLQFMRCTNCSDHIQEGADYFRHIPAALRKNSLPGTRPDGSAYSTPGAPHPAHGGSGCRN